MILKEQTYHTCNLLNTFLKLTQNDQTDQDVKPKQMERLALQQDMEHWDSDTSLNMPSTSKAGQGSSPQASQGACKV